MKQFYTSMLVSEKLVTFFQDCPPATDHAFFASSLHQDVDPFLFLFLGAYSPTLVAVCVALAGRKGAFRELLRSMLRWRVGLAWWATAIFTIPVLNLVFDVASRKLGFVHSPLALSRYYHTLPTLLVYGYIFDDTGPLGEEIGWRGYAEAASAALTFQGEPGLGHDLGGLVYPRLVHPWYWLRREEFRCLSCLLCVHINFNDSHLHPCQI